MTDNRGIMSVRSDGNHLEFQAQNMYVADFYCIALECLRVIVKTTKYSTTKIIMSLIDDLNK